MKRRAFSKCVIGLPYLAAALLWAQPSLVAADGTTTVAVYRFYFNPVQIHFYSTSPAVPGEGWKPEGVAFYVSSVQLPYTVPLYRVYKALLYDHFYTVDAQVKDSCIANLGYTDEGILGYVLPAKPDVEPDVKGSASLYRSVHAYQWSKHTGVSGFGDHTYIYHSQDHFYQTDPSSPPDYTPEGIECRVWKTSVSLPQRLLQIDYPSPGQTLQVGQATAIVWEVWSGGGYVKLSFSHDFGSTWEAITNAPSSGVFDSWNKSSFQWTVPFEALNKVMIRADWTKDASGSTPPWATATAGAFSVESATSPAPNAPTLTAALKGGKEADLSWTNGSAGVTGFSVERKTQGGVYGIISTVGKSTTTYTDISLAPGTTYVYRIRAWSGGKPSSPSNEVSLTTPQPGFHRISRP